MPPAAPSSPTPRERLGLLEVFGLHPLRERLGELAMIFRGDPNTPPTRFGLSSLKIFKPSISLPTWLRLPRKDRRTPIYNFFNHTPTPLAEGWSVRVTQVRDFRGGTLTYDSHNGTDFAIPVGTPVTAPAPGRVLLISNDFHRGGLKLFLDHGQGVFTSSNHLGRTLVQPGEHVSRGQVIALAGASGADLFLCFPWVAPHVHFNVWLNEAYVDPFARAESDEVSLWRTGDHPEPHQGHTTTNEQDFEPTTWDADALQATIDACLDPQLQQVLLDIEDIPQRAMTTFMQCKYFPGRFQRTHRLVRDTFPRTPLLDLPFRPQDTIGVTYPGYPS